MRAGKRAAGKGAKATLLRRGPRVALRRIDASDQEEFVEFVRQSEPFYRPWILAPSGAEEFHRYIKRFDRVTADGFVICLLRTEAMVGFVNINEIVRGPYQRGVIGYGAFASTTRCGYMTEGLGLLLDYAFNDLELHRVEADIQPGNVNSLNLVRRLRFHKEGFSPNFIRINGRWVDHERWAIVRDDVARVLPGARFQVGNW